MEKISSLLESDLSVLDLTNKIDAIFKESCSAEEDTSNYQLDDLRSKIDILLPNMNAALVKKVNNFTSIDMKSIFSTLPDVLNLTKSIQGGSKKSSTSHSTQELRSLLEQRQSLKTQLAETERKIMNLQNSGSSQPDSSSDLLLTITTYHDVLNVLSLCYVYIKNNPSTKSYSENDLLNFGVKFSHEIGQILAFRKGEIISEDVLNPDKKKILVQLWRMVEFVEVFGNRAKVAFDDSRFKELLPQNFAKSANPVPKPKPKPIEKLEVPEPVVVKKSKPKPVSATLKSATKRGWATKAPVQKKQTLKEIQDEEISHKKLEPDQLLGF